MPAGFERRCASIDLWANFARSRRSAGKLGFNRTSDINEISVSVVSLRPAALIDAIVTERGVHRAPYPESLA